jgi:hypothetical protein
MSRSLQRLARLAAPLAAAERRIVGSEIREACRVKSKHAREFNGRIVKANHCRTIGGFGICILCTLVESRRTTQIRQLAGTRISTVEISSAQPRKSSREDAKMETQVNKWRKLRGSKQRRGGERERERERRDSRAHDNKKSRAKNSSERSECTCKSAHTSAGLVRA